MIVLKRDLIDRIMEMELEVRWSYGYAIEDLELYGD